MEKSFETPPIDETAEDEKEDAKPKWEINYDALYAAQEDFVEEAESAQPENTMETDQSPDQKVSPQEEEENEEVKPRWEINYDALYANQEDFVITEEDLESSNSDIHSVKLSNTTQTEHIVSNEDEKNVELDEKPRWEINYDALYASQDDENLESDEGEHNQYTTADSDIGYSVTTSDTTDTEVEKLNFSEKSQITSLDSKNAKDSESSCNEEDLHTPTNIPSSPPSKQLIFEPTPNIPLNIDSKPRPLIKYGRRDSETIASAQKQSTDHLLESVQEKLLAAVQEEEEETSPQDSSNDEKDDNIALRRSRESRAPERDILFSELRNMSSGELSPIVEDEEEAKGEETNDLSKLKQLIPGIAEIRSPGIMSPIPGGGSNSEERANWGEWMNKFIPSYGEKMEEDEYDGDYEGNDKYERDSEHSELDSVYSEADSEYGSDDDDVIEYESYQEIEDNLFVMQTVKEQRPWADVDERDTLRLLRSTNGNKQETILQLIELDKERCKLLGLE